MWDLTFGMNRPAAEKALSASTDVGGSVNNAQRVFFRENGID